MDFIGSALAPNVLTIRTELAALASERARLGHGHLTYRFPDRGKKDTHTDCLNDCALDALRKDDSQNAGLQASFGFAPFLQSTCRDGLLTERNPLEALAAPASLSPLFAQAGLAEPSPFKLHVYAVSPFVLMVDVPQLGDAPLPRDWEDLLHPCYRGHVVTTAEDPVSNVASLAFYERWGAQGLKELYANVAYSASAAVMGQAAGSPVPHRGSIFIAPWFFARLCAVRPGVRMVWPASGALAFPLWLALRTDASDGARAVARYFCSDDFARSSSSVFLPCANDAGTSSLPVPHGSLRWVGWDFLAALDVASYASCACRAAKNVPVMEGL